MKIPADIRPNRDEFLDSYEKKLSTTKTNFEKTISGKDDSVDEISIKKPVKPVSKAEKSTFKSKDLKVDRELRGRFKPRQDTVERTEERQKKMNMLRAELEHEILKDLPDNQDDKVTFTPRHDPLKDLAETKFKTRDQLKAEKRVLFRKKHIVDVLTLYFNGSGSTPIDRLVSTYFKQHREIDAPKNRHYIKDSIFNMIRWGILVEYLYKKNPSRTLPKWEAKLDILEKLPDLVKKESDLPDSIRLSIPSNLFDMLVKDYGKEKAMEIAEVYNTEAPTFGRINPIKTTRDQVIKIFEDKKMEVTVGTTPFGIVFGKRYALSGIHEYQEGLFAIQDESSQMAADLMDPKPGHLVMDYCCGAGGKALAFAHKLKGKGQIYLCDVSHEKLLEAKKRFSHSGVQNINPIQIGHPHLEKIKGKMNWMFVDLPCTGSGTIRRNPDQKYRIDDDYVKKMVEKQREIFEEALRFVVPGGKVIWSVCSILKEEGEHQVAYFSKKYALKIEKTFTSLPIKDGMDGFYASTLKVPDFYLFPEERKVFKAGEVKKGVAKEDNPVVKEAVKVVHDKKSSRGKSGSDKKKSKKEEDSDEE
jgi:16S rRNA (cytosine967-C5)-methyltransferase